MAVKDLLQSDGEFDILSVDSDRPATCNSLPLAGGGPFSVPPAAGAVAGVDRRYQLDCTLDDPLGVLAADGPPNTGRWILTVRAQADSAQSLNNVATGVADVPDPDTSNNQDETATRIANDADLRMIKIASPSGPVLAGDQISYLLVVDNLGPSAASGVSIVDAITSDGLFDLVGVNPNVDGNRPTATCAPLGPRLSTMTVYSTGWPMTWTSSGLASLVTTMSLSHVDRVVLTPAAWSPLVSPGAASHVATAALTMLAPHAKSPSNSTVMTMAMDCWAAIWPKAHVTTSTGDSVQRASLTETNDTPAGRASTRPTL